MRRSAQRQQTDSEDRPQQSPHRSAPLFLSPHSDKARSLASYLSRAMAEQYHRHKVIPMPIGRNSPVYYAVNV